MKKNEEIPMSQKGLQCVCYIGPRWSQSVSRAMLDRPTQSEANSLASCARSFSQSKRGSLHIWVLQFRGVRSLDARRCGLACNPCTLVKSKHAFHLPFLHLNQSPPPKKHSEFILASVFIEHPNFVLEKCSKSWKCHIIDGQR